MTCKNHVFSDSGIMIAPEPGTEADPLILDYQNKQLLCIGLTVTYEKVTLTRKKNTIKILAKLYESATSDSILQGKPAKHSSILKSNFFFHFQKPVPCTFC